MVHALCPSCTNINELNACFHCMQPLCFDCTENHLNSWKESSFKYCQTTKSQIDEYKKKISLLEPLINQNKTNAENVKLEIEKSFECFVKQLTKEKNELFIQIDSIQDENEKFILFEKEIFNFKESLENLMEKFKNGSKSEIDKLRPSLEDLKRKKEEVSSNYSKLRNQPFKIIGEYDLPETRNLANSFFGNIIITEFEKLPEIEDINDVKKDQEHLRKSSEPIKMFGTLRIKLKRFADQTNLNLQIKEPYEEYEIPISPKFTTSNSKNIYICNENGDLIIADYNNKKFQIKKQIKLDIFNIKGLAVDKNFLAVSFTDLNKNQLNSLNKIHKDFNDSSGVAIFKLQDFSLEKIISSSKNFVLVSPEALSLSDNFLFVCDKESHCLFKIDLKKTSLVQRLISNQPSSISIGNKYLVFTDLNQMELNLVDVEKFTIVKSLKLSQDFFNESVDLAFREKSFVFVKYTDDVRCFVYDPKLNFKYSFDYENSKKQGMAYIQQNGNGFLIIGKFEAKKFKIGFFNGF
ncbi:unnamed protein product [Brachionus calyciflorus]|uniref:Uncharacterized protein n=1 Tax=Brachionus calyciflorus TaxID=104777 RepID=A0A813M1S6_9BILA|nr:unnamed protein product [Brachionus calyciflorus]